MKKMVMLAAGILAVLVLMAGCAEQDETFAEKHYASDGAQIEGIVLDVRDRRIEVTCSPDDQVYIDYFESDKESYEISVTEDHILTMDAVSNREWKDYIGGKASAEFRSILLQVPDGLLQQLSLTTTNEEISVSELSVSGDVVLSNNGGDISFVRLDAGNSIMLQGKNGEISGSIAGSYDDYAISSSIKKGESNLPQSKESGTKKLQASNNNGDIAIDFLPQ